MNETLKSFVISRQSSVSGQLNKRIVMLIETQRRAIQPWLAGGRRSTLIQEVVSQLSADDREFIISGITPEERARVFGNEKY